MKTLGTSLALGALFTTLLAASAAADPLMGKSGWSPPQNANRASIASLMLQHEQMRRGQPDSYAGAIFTCGGSGGGGTGGVGGEGGGTGGGGGAGGNTTASNATANNNCTIVVGSKGTVISADQISDGDQTASSDSDTTSTTTSSVGESSLSSILEAIE